MMQQILHVNSRFLWHFNDFSHISEPFMPLAPAARGSDKRLAGLYVLIRGQTSEEVVRRPSGSLFKVPFSGLYWNLDTAGVPFEDDEAEVCFHLCRCSHTKENCHSQLGGAVMASHAKAERMACL